MEDLNNFKNDLYDFLQNTDDLNNSKLIKWIDKNRTTYNKYLKKINDKNKLLIKKVDSLLLKRLN